MFDYTKMIKRAIEFFPLWTDIRKRYNTSIGGNFLSSIIDEEITIKETIQEYIDSYFLYNYIGHEDEVMAFSYMANVGKLIAPDETYVYYNDSLFPFADNAKQFEEGNTRVYYEDGKIYLKVEDYVEGIDNFKLIIDDQEAFYNISKVHVWNIFDEFATFVNTRRQENETNKQLVDRILYITKNLPNGTEAGLKHAIISELMTDFPDITEEEIIIEQPTPENLIKAYEDYETLLDLLAEVNRDVYRTKRWDLDYWEYNFESISYIPHIWDKVIRDWQNGVGSYNDLEVILTDKNDTTDVDIYFYKKTLEAFQKFVYNKYLDNDIHFTMTRYNDILNKRNIKYKISASELNDITYDDIKMKLYESKKQTKKVLIQDLAVDWGKNISRIDNSIIEDIYEYRMDIESDTGYDLKISKANIIYQNKETGETLEVLDLMEQKPGFIMNSEYELVSDATKLNINAVEHFTTHSGLVNDGECITIAPGESKGHGIISLTDKAGMYVNYIYDCDRVSIPNSLLNSRGGYWAIDDNNEDVYVIRGDYSTEEKILKFSIEANIVSFDIHESSANSRILLTLTDNGVITEYNLSDKSHFETELTSEPRNLTLELRVLSINDVKLNNFKYNSYSVLLSTKFGSLEKTNQGYKLPNYYNNELKVELVASSGHNPMLEGIFIGESFKNIKYTTDSIPYKNNCIRIFEIVTNGIIRLNKLGADNNIIDSIENFEPYMSYKATDDPAYLRLDLSSYDSLDKIDPDIGSIEMIEESGAIYYNLRLKNGQTATKITITGTKTVEAREVTLEDIVKFYVPDFDATYDRIYCCKCSKGLIIGRTNPGGSPYNILINVKSEIFTGLKIVKYVMNLPSNYGAIYGSNNGYENRSNTSYAAFDYISIYPAGSQIYQAINEYDTYLNDSKFIPIANNFSPALNANKILFYSVELYDKEFEENTVIRFHNAQNSEIDIYDLPSWSIGTSNSYIAIRNNIDLFNEAIYDMTTYNIDDKIFLSSSVNIKDSYTLTDHTILNTEKFIIATDNDQVTIKYDYYDGTSKKEHLLKYEEIFIESDGFNKLTYSNIDTIFHCSLVNSSLGYSTDVEFEILKEQGIIIWKNNSLIDKNAKVYLVYSIKKPVAFVFGLDYLYKAIDYDIEAYDHIGEFKATNIKDGQVIELLDNTWEPEISRLYKESDLIYASCTSPTFEAKLEDDLITINKYLKEDTVLVKTGYYYINGREYYLFSEEDAEDIKNNSFYTSHNVDVSGGEFTTYKETNNYLANSEMRLKGFAKLYNFNCKKPLTYGISRFDYLTACNTFDQWETFETKMKLVDGLNGLAIQFTPQVENGYAYIEITDALKDNIDNYVSFYATKNLKTFVGKEKKYLDLNFERSLNIDIEEEVLYENSDIRYTIVKKERNSRYYLIVQAEGVIDDIIISDSKNSTFEAHNKNITLLGFDLYEKKPEGSQYKITLKSDKDYKSYHASLMSDGSVKTTSSLDWYVTEIKSYRTNNDYKNCKLTNIGVNKTNIYTGNHSGILETLPIYIGDISNIKNIIIKINDIDIDGMTGFTTSVSCSNSYNGEFVACCPAQLHNRFHIQNKFLNSYIKLKIEIPSYRYIKDISIFAEYTSTDDNPLMIKTQQTGYIESKLYDLQEVVDCRIRSIDIEDISNINDIDIYIRASRDNEYLDVWTDWKKIAFDDFFKLTNVISFTNTRFLQYKIVVKTRDSFIKFKGITIEIK